ncbi:hypothetical protein [Natrinema sp. CGMCC1.2065]|uniref:hypothetical protein n=1 Tax=Natrinema sp. CGMCC1.2065 TaxID=3445767 RepID=UPI003F49BB1B
MTEDSRPNSEELLEQRAGEVADDHSIRCYDCEHVVPRHDVSIREIVIPHQDGFGYEEVPVPLCRSCRLERFGHSCDLCGRRYLDLEAALRCCDERLEGGRLRADGGLREAPEGFVRCIRCDGSGEYIECYDDLCHANGRCTHGNNTCALCRGYRFISRELRNKWESRDAFAAVDLPEADMRFRGIDPDEAGGESGGQ